MRAKTKEPTEWDRWVEQFKESNKCIFPEREYTHKVACREPATHKSEDGLPSCKWHQNFNMREEWAGLIEGA